MKKTLLVGSLILGLFLTSGFADKPAPEAVILSLEKSDAPPSWLRGMDLDVLMERDGRVYVVASAADLQKIRAAGMPYRLETQNFQPSAPLPSQAGGDLNGDFHDYYEVGNELRDLESTYPGLAKLSILGDSLEGRHIYALKISANVQADENEARVLFLGCHHAREWISVEVPLLFARYALEGYSSDAEIKRLLDNSEVWIVPLVNPDGLEYSIRYYRYWRKNRRDNGDGTFGVDINRNYGYAWGWDNVGSSPTPESEIYRGTAAFSEPETQAVRDFMFSRRFQALITYHSFAQDILFPWGYTTDPAADGDKLQALAAGISQRIQAVNGRVYVYGEAGSLLYLTNGDLVDWAYGVFGAMAFTIELPPQDYASGAFFNAETDILPIFRENIPAMTYLIDESIASYVAPGTAHSPRDGRTEPPVRVKRAIKD